MKKRFGLLLLAVGMMFSAASCGKTAGANGETAFQYVYVPEFYKIERGENDWFSGVTFRDDKVYYCVQGYDETKGVMSNSACRRLP